jgi:hypothetical protein
VTERLSEEMESQRVADSLRRIHSVSEEVGSRAAQAAKDLRESPQLPSLASRLSDAWTNVAKSGQELWGQKMMNRQRAVGAQASSEDRIIPGLLNSGSDERPFFHVPSIDVSPLYARHQRSVLDISAGVAVEPVSSKKGCREEDASSEAGLQLEQLSDEIAHRSTSGTLQFRSYRQRALNFSNRFDMLSDQVGYREAQVSKSLQQSLYSQTKASGLSGAFPSTTQGDDRSVSEPEEIIILESLNESQGGAGSPDDDDGEAIADDIPGINISSILVSEPSAIQVQQLSKFQTKSSGICEVLTNATQGGDRNVTDPQGPSFLDEDRGGDGSPNYDDDEPNIDEIPSINVSSIFESESSAIREVLRQSPENQPECISTRKVSTNTRKDWVRSVTDPQRPLVSVSWNENLEGAGLPDDETTMDDILSINVSSVYVSEPNAVGDVSVELTDGLLLPKQVRQRPSLNDSAPLSWQGTSRDAKVSTTTLSKWKWGALLRVGNFRCHLEAVTGRLAESYERTQKFLIDLVSSVEYDKAWTHAFLQKSQGLTRENVTLMSDDKSDAVGESLGNEKRASSNSASVWKAEASTLVSVNRSILEDEKSAASISQEDSGAQVAFPVRRNTQRNQYFEAQPIAQRLFEQILPSVAGEPLRKDVPGYIIQSAVFSTFTWSFVLQRNDLWTSMWLATGASYLSVTTGWQGDLVRGWSIAVYELIDFGRSDLAVWARDSANEFAALAPFQRRIPTPPKSPPPRVLLVWDHSELFFLVPKSVKAERRTRSLMEYRFELEAADRERRRERVAERNARCLLAARLELRARRQTIKAPILLPEAQSFTKVPKTLPAIDLMEQLFFLVPKSVKAEQRSRALLEFRIRLESEERKRRRKSVAERNPRSLLVARLQQREWQEALSPLDDLPSLPNSTAHIESEVGEIVVVQKTLGSERKKRVREVNNTAKLFEYYREQLKALEGRVLAGIRQQSICKQERTQRALLESRLKFHATQRKMAGSGRSQRRLIQEQQARADQVRAANMAWWAEENRAWQNAGPEWHAQLAADARQDRRIQEAQAVDRVRLTEKVTSQFESNRIDQEKRLAREACNTDEWTVTDEARVAVPDRPAREDRAAKRKKQSKAQLNNKIAAEAQRVKEMRSEQKAKQQEAELPQKISQELPSQQNSKQQDAQKAEEAKRARKLVSEQKGKQQEAQLAHKAEEAKRVQEILSGQKAKQHKLELVEKAVEAKHVHDIRSEQQVKQRKFELAQKPAEEQDQRNLDKSGMEDKRREELSSEQKEKQRKGQKAEKAKLVQDVLSEQEAKQEAWLAQKADEAKRVQEILSGQKAKQRKLELAQKVAEAQREQDIRSAQKAKQRQLELDKRAIEAKHVRDIISNQKTKQRQLELAQKEADARREQGIRSEQKAKQLQQELDQKAADAKRVQAALSEQKTKQREAQRGGASRQRKKQQRGEVKRIEENRSIVWATLLEKARAGQEGTRKNAETKLKVEATRVPPEEVLTDNQRKILKAKKVEEERIVKQALLAEEKRIAERERKKKQARLIEEQRNAELTAERERKAEQARLAEEKRNAKVAAEQQLLLERAAKAEELRRKEEHEAQATQAAERRKREEVRVDNVKAHVAAGQAKEESLRVARKQRIATEHTEEQRVLIAALEEETRLQEEAKRKRIADEEERRQLVQAPRQQRMDGSGEKPLEADHPRVISDTFAVQSVPSKADKDSLAAELPADEVIDLMAGSVPAGVKGVNPDGTEEASRDNENGIVRGFEEDSRQAMHHFKDNETRLALEEPESTKSRVVSEDASPAVWVPKATRSQDETFVDIFTYSKPREGGRNSAILEMKDTRAAPQRARQAAQLFVTLALSRPAIFRAAAAARQSSGQA